MRTNPVYEARLSKDEFLDLEVAVKPIPFDKNPHNWVLRDLAETINTQYKGDFISLSKLNEFFMPCVHIAHDWDDRKMGHITLCLKPPRQNYLIIADGNHRCIAYASLVLSEKIRYEPIRAIIRSQTI